MKVRCFTQQFYDDKARWVEMLSKNRRPYLMVEIKLEGCGNCYIPLRSSVTDKHKHFFPTKPPAGLDYSKSIFLTDAEILLYVDRQRTPTIDKEEFKIISGAEKLIKRGMKQYISDYKDAKKRLGIEANRILVSRSTLQYFEEFI